MPMNRHSLRLAIGAITTVLYLGRSAVGQAPDHELLPVAMPPAVTPRPTVPEQLPRPLEGSQPDQQFGPPAQAPGPVAGSFEALKSNDAAIRLTVEQSRILTTKFPVARENDTALIAVSDPSIVDFNVLPNPRMIRLVGLRAGVTDLSIITVGGEAYSFEIHVGWDLDLLSAHLQATFPDAQIKLSQLREHVVVSGQARSTRQVALILQTIQAHLASVQARRDVQSSSTNVAVASSTPAPPQPNPDGNSDSAPNAGVALPEGGERPETDVDAAPAQIINLLQVPGVQQVMLQVQIAELNRTALREVGADILGVDPDTGNVFGTNLGNSTVRGLAAAGNIERTGLIQGPNGLLGAVTNDISNATNAFFIMPSADLSIMLNALRENSILSLLAEPNLIAMHGHRASFLAGGQFPVPVPQVSNGVANAITIQFKDFGVRLDFTPYILEDDTIRLRVEPEVSSIDFSIGTTLVVGGTPVPGLNTRRAEATVELKPGQTLAMAGLLQVTLEATTSRIPGLGDVPYLGPLFSNTSHKRIEKELLVMVTPHLVAPMDPEQVGSLPGTEIKDPTDKEFYLYNRIEGRTCQSFRAPVEWDKPIPCLERHDMERCYGCGPIGLSE